MTLLRTALFLAVFAVAAEHPNFSGTWKLNLAESDFSDKHASAPDNLTLTVHQNGTDLRYDSQREKDGGKSQGHVDLTIGVSLDLNSGATAAANWTGDKLVFKMLQGQAETDETWSLSTDGKKLTSDMIVHLPKNSGEAHVKRVFEKRN
jgi:hypothetical protein